MALTLFNDPALSEVAKVMDRMTEQMFGWPVVARPRSAVVHTPATQGASHLPMDIVETATAYEIHADTPGMAPENVKIELQDGVLTVSGERKIARDDKDKSGKVWRSERSAFSFSRSFTLPDNANADDIRATMDKGVLTVTMPKKDPPAKPEPKRIAVTGL